MNILVVEDNFLVAEMLRMAVEDAGFTVVGPVKSVEDGTRLATSNALDGALLDIHLGGTHSFPVARLLRSNGVPFIFVTGYDASVLPQDLKDVPFMPKPIVVRDITRLALESFGTGNGAAETSARAAQLRDRIIAMEARVETQKKRVTRLKFQGASPADAELATDILEQMVVAIDLLQTSLTLLEDPFKKAARRKLDGPIDDEVVDLGDPGSLHFWSQRLGIPAEKILEIGDEVGPSARTIQRTFSRHARTGGVPRKSSI